MTNIASVIRAAQRALTEQPQPNWADVDTLSDEQLEWLAGPGYPETKVWDESNALPTTAAGLVLLAGIIEGAAEAQELLRLRKIAGPAQAAAKEKR